MSMCLIIGIVCIISSIFKAWLSQPIYFDWFILSGGLILLILSLFLEYKLNADLVK